MTVAAAPMTRDEAIELSGARTFKFFQLHNPAFWLYILLVANGAYIYAMSFADMAVKPSAIVLAIFLEVLYTVPMWWFITHTDRFDREPAKVAVVGFLWGGLVATWVMAGPANVAVLSLYAKLISVDFATSWGPAFTAPITEETSKFAGLIILVLLARNYIRSTYDGMILGAFVGLGFQVFENVQYIVNGIGANFNQNPVQDGMKVFGMRTLTGFYTHAVYTAIAGAGLGYFLSRKDKSKAHRWMVMIGLLILAMIVHGLLDASVAVAALAVLAGIASILAIILVWRFADRGERAWIAVIMADEVTNRTITQGELDVISGKRKTRKHYLAQVEKEQGKASAKKAEHVLDAGYDLAAAIASTDDPSSPKADHARAEIARLRGVDGMLVAT
jgi:protease PrsW